MTVCGVTTTRDGFAAWADDAVVNRYTGTAKRRPKLAINPVAGCVLTGAGWATLFPPAERALQAGGSLDELLGGVVTALRLQAPHSAAGQPPAGCLDFAGNVALLAGWSDAWGRMVAYRLDAAAFFEPVMVMSATLPEVEWIAGELPHMTAAGQAALFADPTREVGNITIITATRNGMTVRPPQQIGTVPVPDLAADGSVPPGIAAGPDAGAGPVRFLEAAHRPEHHHQVAA